MWPLTDRKELRGPESAQTRELERRYREHLATQPPDRLKLFESEVSSLSAKGPVLNASLMADCVQTAKDFKHELADNPDIAEVRPGYSKDYLCISVLVKPGVDINGCRERFPEFFRGYMVRCGTAQL